MKRLIVVAVLAAALGGCASMTRGTKEDVRIEVEPANAAVTTDLGEAFSCTGPCTLKVPRKKEFTVTATAPGYEPETVAVETRMSGGGTAGLAGNVLVGGVIGIGIDAANGAMLDHTPNPVIIRLKPIGDPLAPAAPSEGPVARPEPAGVPVS